MKFKRILAGVIAVVMLISALPLIAVADEPLSPFERHGKLQIINGQLSDQAGKPVQLRGMSTHGLQWNVGQWILTEAAFADLADDWQSDVIRLAMYVGEGGYAVNPRTILDRVEWAIQEATKHGMYVIVDWHVHAPGNPTDPVYLEAGLNADNMPADFIAIRDANPTWTGPQVFFAYIAFKYGKQGNVLYETANEPSGLGSMENRFNVWSNILKPYHESVIKAIREYETKTTLNAQADTDGYKGIVICGTDNWSQFIDAPIDNPIKDPQVMYTMHFYSGTHDTGSLSPLEEAEKRLPPGETIRPADARGLEAAGAEGIVGHYWLRQMADAALDAGLAIFASEWGVSEATGDGGPYIDWAKRWVDYMADNNISWTAWSLTNKAEISGAFTMIDGSNPDLPDAPLASWNKVQRTVTGNFYRAMIRGDEVPMYRDSTQVTSFGATSPRFSLNADNPNEALKITYETVGGQTIANISGISTNGIWDNRLQLSDLGIDFGSYRNIEFDVYLPVTVANGNAAAFEVKTVLQYPPDWWNDAMPEHTVTQSDFSPVAGTNWAKASVNLSLAPLNPATGDTLGHIVFLVSLAGATADSNVGIGNISFSYSHNGDISNFPGDPKGEFIKLPFDFESGTREGWWARESTLLENEDLSIGIAETSALMFPFTFVQGQGGDDARISSPDNIIPPEEQGEIDIITLEVFLEDGKATRGHLVLNVVAQPNGDPWWYQAGSYVIDPINGGSLFTNPEGVALRKYFVSVPFSLEDYPNTDIQFRNFVLQLQNGENDDWSDYSGYVFYDNIGFETMGEPFGDTGTGEISVPNPPTGVTIVFTLPIWAGVAMIVSGRKKNKK